jgi:carboxyl-terminal processing protease
MGAPWRILERWSSASERVRADHALEHQLQEAACGWGDAEGLDDRDAAPDSTGMRLRLRLPRMRTLRAAIAACVFLAALPALLLPASGAGADAALVIAALRVLEQEYVKPVDPVRLLNAALDGLRPVASVDLPEIPAGTVPYQAEASFRRAFARVTRADGAQTEDLAFRAVRAMLASLRDTHTYYLDPPALKQHVAQDTGQPGYPGIGALLGTVKDASGTPLVVYAAAVFPGSPAEAAGLRPFDQFAAVDGVPVPAQATVLDVAAMIRGPAGSSVALTVRRNGQAVQVVITRQAIETPTVSWRMIQPGIGYIQVFVFAAGASAKFREALRALEALAPLRGLVLDLRGNGGGYDTELEQIAATLLPVGSVLAHTLNRQGPADVVTTERPLLPRTPIVVLTDANTASSAEALSLALRDAHRAVLVGEKTVGALGDTDIVPLPAGGMGVTVAEVYGPRYEQVEGVGVSPDEQVPLTAADVSSATDAPLQAALAILSVSALPATRAQP